MFIAKESDSIDHNHYQMKNQLKPQRIQKFDNLCRERRWKMKLEFLSTFVCLLVDEFVSEVENHLDIFFLFYMSLYQPLKFKSLNSLKQK